MLLAIAAGNKRPIVPHMEFEYPDAEIHEDLYQLMKYSCGEVCTAEQLDKVMKIWTTFVEPVLGVPTRIQGSEDSDDSVRPRNGGVRNNGHPISEKDGSPSQCATTLKQSNCSRDEVEGSPLEQSSSGNHAKQDGYPDASNNMLHLVRAQNNGSMVDQISELGKQTMNSELPASSNVPLSSGVEQFHVRSTENVSGLYLILHFFLSHEMST